MYLLELLFGFHEMSPLMYPALLITAMVGGPFECTIDFQNSWEACCPALNNGCGKLANETISGASNFNGEAPGSYDDDRYLDDDEGMNATTPILIAVFMIWLCILPICCGCVFLCDSRVGLGQRVVSMFTVVLAAGFLGAFYPWIMLALFPIFLVVNACDLSKAVAMAITPFAYNPVASYKQALQESGSGNFIMGNLGKPKAFTPPNRPKKQTKNRSRK